MSRPETTTTHCFCESIWPSSAIDPPITGVTFGDTILFGADGHWIRLVSINKPETYEPVCEKGYELGKQATACLKDLLSHPFRIASLDADDRQDWERRHFGEPRRKNSSERTVPSLSAVFCHRAPPKIALCHARGMPGEQNSLKLSNTEPSSDVADSEYVTFIGHAGRRLYRVARAHFPEECHQYLGNASLLRSDGGEYNGAEIASAIRVTVRNIVPFRLIPEHLVPRFSLMQ